MPVDRMQWGAEEWQFADLYMPDEPSPYQKEVGVPCVMLIHGGFWKDEYGQCADKHPNKLYRDIGENERMSRIRSKKHNYR